MLALAGWGGYAVTQLPIDALPDITNNQVQVITRAPALSAQEIEQFITAPVELALANIPQQVEIRSVSRMGISVITVVFEETADVLRCRQLVSEQLKVAENDIDANFGQPELMPITTGLGEIYQYIIRPRKGYENRYNLSDLRTIQDWVVRRQLSGTPGVIEISSFGGFQKEYEVSVDPERLRASQVTLTELFHAIETNNANTGGSYIEKGSEAFFIRGEGLVKSLADIESIVVRTQDGIPLLVRDIAEVRYGHAVRYGAMTYNGVGETAGGVVMMLKGANSAATIRGVKERITAIEKTLPEGLEIHPFLDRTRLVNRAISTVSRNLLEGGLIVVFVLVILLGSWRAGLVVASVIPLSMLFTLGMMNLFGISANLMSLGAIDFGLIVDGAVIIVESVVHHLHRRFEGLKAGRVAFEGGPPRGLKVNMLPTSNPSNLKPSNPPTMTMSQAEMDGEVIVASSKIRRSAAFGEIIILMVYLPILALEGVEGKMFVPMAQTVSFAILGALVLSLTYVPMAASVFLSKRAPTKKTFSDRLMGRLYRVYEPVIRWALAHKVPVLAGALALLIGTGLLFTQLGGEFIPTLDEGDFAIDTRMPTGSSLTSEIELTRKAEKILLEKFPEVKEVVGKIGSAEVPTDPMPIEAADLMVILKEDKSEWTSAKTRDELAEKMSAELAVLAGGYFDVQQPIQMRFNELMTGVKSDIAVKIYGENLDVLFQKANECARLIEPIDGVADCKVEQIQGLPQMVVNYRRDKIAQYGVNVADLNALVRTAFAGQTAGVVFEGEKRFNLVVRLDSAHRLNLENLRQLDVPLPGGGQLPLSELADVGFRSAPVQISRDDTRRRITIGINARGRDIESLVAEIQRTIESKVKLPPGYSYRYGGAFENLQAAKARLSVAVPIALLLIFVLLFLTFHSLPQTLMIFTAIPLSAIGGVLALWLRYMPFSISAGVGFIALFGVSVLNGIVLIGQFNQSRDEGFEGLDERILHGVKIRFRPVLMTAAVASLGFLPMALSASSGAEVQRPLATVVIGGLLSSTLLTLVVLPVIYGFFTKKKDAQIQP
ncbi:MAG: efflux RND transporter permease subunit [Cytophagaceae bacterium]|nr:efflux RND transporter permease subunit [Cytophagaceae bacterium]